MNNTQTLENKIEAVLFYRAEPLSIEELARLCDVSTAAVEEALTRLLDELKERGVRLQRAGNTVELVTAPEYADAIRALVKEEREQELGKAALETLAIVAYSGPITRAEIDHIRGVNSSFTLRQLLVRGLLQKEQHKTDSRKILYAPTLALLSHLGITDVKDLPQYEEFEKDIEAFMHADSEEDKETEM